MDSIYVILFYKCILQLKYLTVHIEITALQVDTIRYESLVIRLHVSASSGRPQGGIQQRKTQNCQFMSQNLQPIIFSIVVSQDCWRQLRTVHGMLCKLICQRILGAVGDWQEGRDLNGKTLAADNGRQQSSKEASRVRVWCRWEYREVTVSVCQT